MKSILVVSSNMDNLLTLSSVLSRSGYCVIARLDAGSALSIIRQGVEVDVVISDYLLPDMDPRIFFTSLKRISAAPPVIFLSDNVNVKDYLNALSLGAFEFLYRPVHPSELLRIVDVAIQRGADVHGLARGNQRESVSPSFFTNDSTSSASLSMFE